MTRPIPEWPAAGITGHRPSPRNPVIGQHEEWITKELERIIVLLRDGHGTRVLHSGLALGPDTWAATLALRCHLTLWAHIPYPQQAARWNARQRAHRTALLAAAGQQVTTYGGMADVQHIHARNRGLVNSVGVLIAVWDVRVLEHGTFETVKYAANLPDPIPIIVIDPARQTVRRPSNASIRRLIAAA
jgi:hypothetical protein